MSVRGSECECECEGSECECEGGDGCHRQVFFLLGPERSSEASGRPFTPSRETAGI